MTQTLQFSLLTEQLIRYRSATDGQTHHVNLPELFVALTIDVVRDYPALQPHQRHPWHAFLVQLAAIAMHQASRTHVFETAAEWREALLALTPADQDGAAWCLVSPPNRPALLQAAVPDGNVSAWKSEALASDEIDMLVTSKNHDLKSGRSRRSLPDDWLYALLSLQTQEGFLGAGNYGISRMNGGFASKPGIGVAEKGYPGARWLRDVGAVLARRGRTAEDFGLQAEGGVALVWLAPWDGLTSLSFNRLDPLYIEICRRIRLQCRDGALGALGTGTSVARITSKSLNGLTGDAWTPIDMEGGKALTITSNGFGYKLLYELIFGSKYQAPVAQNLAPSASGAGLVFIAQGIARGKGKTEGYHERRVPISPKLRVMLAGGQKDVLAKLAAKRIAAIGEVRKLLWLALAVLFANGKSGDSTEGIKAKAGRFSAPFEAAEDPRFFDDLNAEIEATDPAAQHLQWLLGLVSRAEAVLKIAFDAGPRSGVQKYRAQSAALSRFHGGLRANTSPLTELLNYYRQQKTQRQEETLDNT